MDPRIPADLTNAKSKFAILTNLSWYYYIEYIKKVNIPMGAEKRYS